MEEKAKSILDYFEQINAIPRCSKNEEQIGLWLKQWAETKQLAVKKDAARQPAGQSAADTRI